MGKTLFRNCRYLIARPDRREMLQGASILTSGTDIVAVGTHREIEELVDREAGIDIVACSSKIVMPGLAPA